ncbi:hypothetical protein F9C07_1856388 [Aspergillus flavus]|uniref:Chemokine interleukin-8-like domain-containing protein n=1 Tax=Aspergillus flavus (strain ATCC 200026 / FGSC A1120 / IAM 13836 / NRRL 3357 / JCM 12722 / SRRC 167) TaxID=332952 RepID=A0A7U2R240_ASPFN|nr:hypothetical protein F9C07_1856388 [Aspergillus flavus]
MSSAVLSRAFLCQLSLICFPPLQSKDQKCHCSLASRRHGRWIWISYLGTKLKPAYGVKRGCLNPDRQASINLLRVWLPASIRNTLRLIEGQLDGTGGSSIINITPYIWGIKGAPICNSIKIVKLRTEFLVGNSL